MGTKWDCWSLNGLAMMKNLNQVGITNIFLSRFKKSNEIGSVQDYRINVLLLINFLTD